MAKITWESSTDKLNKEQKEKDKLKYKGTSFETLSSKEKDKLLKMALTQLGLL